ncbi:MAG: serine hydrolase [Bacteroidota bacterium]
MRSLLAALALIALTSAAAAQSVLQPGEPVERDLASGEAHPYTLDLDADQFVLGVADQLTVDVVVRVTDPDGERVGVYDGPARGPEPFSFTTEVAGTYTVTVTPYATSEGRYVLRLDRAEPVATTPAGTIDQLFAQLDNDRSPGAAVGVIQRGEVVFAQAYGMASLTHGVPFTTETPSNIASTSKQFTAFAVAALAEQGVLSLDDDVREHIPELPDFGETVTLRHLLTHTSGYREYLTSLTMAGLFHPEDRIDRDDVVGVVVRQPELQNAPGAEWNYNNTGYGLLALAAERASGVPFQDWSRANIFEPLGMDRTRVRTGPAEIVPGRAVGHDTGDDGMWQEVPDLGGAMGDGFVYTTVLDLLRWMDTYRTAGGSGARRAMTTEYVTSAGDSTGYGLGLFLREHRGLRTVEHGGSDAGHRADFVYYPEIESGIVVLTNSSLVPARAREIADVFFADAFPPEPTPEAPLAAEVDAPEPTPDAEPFDAESFAPADFDAYVGRYEFDTVPGVVLTFSREDDRLLLQVLDRTPIEIVPVGTTTFEAPSTGARAEFFPDDDGTVTRVVYTSARSYPSTRLPDEDPIVPEAYAGRYVSDELGALYTIRVEDEELTLTHVRLDNPSPLRHITGDRFTGGGPLGDLEFERGEDGSVTGFVAGAGRTRDVRFERIE